MAVKLIDELQKEIKAAGEAVTQEAYEKAYDHVFQIGLIKGTSLAFVCAVVEMTAAGKIIAGRTYRYFEVYVSLAIIYWIITIIVEQGIKLIEKKIRIPENAPAIQTDEGVLNQ